MAKKQTNGKANGHATAKIASKNSKVIKKDAKKVLSVAKHSSKVVPRQPKFTKAEIATITKECQQVRDTKFQRVKQKAQEIVDSGVKNSFYVFDLSEVKHRIELWRKLLPRVEVFYAAKVNPDKKVVDECVKHNSGFDVASSVEITQMLEQGAKPENLIYANPIKSEEMLKLAKKHGVSLMTFDNHEELYRIKKFYPKADCVIRIETESTSAVYNLNEKFGAEINQVPELLELAKKLGLRVKGVCFHTGSGGVTLPSYESSIKNARKIFDMALGLGMKEMDFLDIGGGFTLITPDTGKNFEEVAPAIGAILNEHFPEPHVKIIAEPGRYISEDICHLVCRIIG